MARREICLPVNIVTDKEYMSGVALWFKSTFLNNKTVSAENYASIWLYFYGWVLALVIGNIVFFGMVACILLRNQNDRMLKQTREKNRDRWAQAQLPI